MFAGKRRPVGFGQARVLNTQTTKWLRTEGYANLYANHNTAGFDSILNRPIATFYPYNVLDVVDFDAMWSSYSNLKYRPMGYQDVAKEYVQYRVMSVQYNFTIDVDIHETTSATIVENYPALQGTHMILRHRLHDEDGDLINNQRYTNFARKGLVERDLWRQMMKNFRYSGGPFYDPVLGMKQIQYNTMCHGGCKMKYTVNMPDHYDTPDDFENTWTDVYNSTPALQDPSGLPTTPQLLLYIGNDVLFSRPACTVHIRVHWSADYEIQFRDRVPIQPVNETA